MKVFTTVSQIVDYRSTLGDQIVGFVPTMGALHKGHLSLIEISKQQTAITIASIFVNPTQFNEQADYNRYPRTTEADLALLEAAGCDAVFLPTEQEIYPTVDTRKFNFGNLETVMDGLHRPGHFNGVAQVVSRLFEIVQPHKAVFGQKDFQQLAIIRAMCKQLCLTIEIIAAPIVRENDGLAMSSRNMLLTKDQRIEATMLFQALSVAQSLCYTIPINELKDRVIAFLETIPNLKPEYFEVIDGDSLQALSDWDQSNHIYACLAVRIGEIRLIDNTELQNNS